MLMEDKNTDNMENKSETIIKLEKEWHDKLLEVEEQEKLLGKREFIKTSLKKGEIDPEKLQQHLKCLIIAEVVLWGGFIVYLFISKGY